MLDDLRSAAGPRAVHELADYVAAAAALLDAGRPEAALPFAEEVKRRAPRSRFGRELLGLVSYRMGRFKQAVGELRAYRRMSGDRGRDVVLADAERGAGQRASARRRLLAVVSDPSAPEADRVEALIVLAGMHADDGDLASARDVLMQGPVAPRALEDHHLRLWYSIADLAERSGRAGDAVEWFSRVEVADADFEDVGDRLRRLRGKDAGRRS